MFGSIHNRLAERVVPQVPEVGMGAYGSYYTDKRPYTIVELSPETITVTFDTKDVGKVTRTYPKWILAVEDEAKIISGTAFNGSAQYEFSEGDRAYARKFIFHKPSGLYREETKRYVATPNSEFPWEYVGSGRTRKDNTPLIIGYRDKYYDPSF